MTPLLPNRSNLSIATGASSLSQQPIGRLLTSPSKQTLTTPTKLQSVPVHATSSKSDDGGWRQHNPGGMEDFFPGLPCYSGSCSVLEIPGRLDNKGCLVDLDSSSVEGTDHEEAHSRLKYSLQGIQHNTWHHWDWHPWYHEGPEERLDLNVLKEKVSVLREGHYMPVNEGQLGGFRRASWTFNILSEDHCTAVQPEFPRKQP